MKLLEFRPETYQGNLVETEKVLASGGLVVFPTETCYGLGVAAIDARAVSKLLTYKGGRQNKAISIAVENLAMARRYVKLNDTALHLINELLPGPLTVVCPDRGKVVRQLVSDANTLGIRIPDYSPIRQLIGRLGLPITATSANTSGKKPPYSYDDLVRYTSRSKLAMIDLFLDAGPLPHRLPSTVVDTTHGMVEVLRSGSVDFALTATTTRRALSAAETQDIGYTLMNENVDKLGKTALIFALAGPLGSGKTQMVKGIARALDLEQTISSPTYQVMREYEYNCGKVGGKLLHIDTWRLENVAELEDFNVENLIMPTSVIVVEWMERAVDWIRSLPRPFKVVWVEIEGVGDEPRKIQYFMEDIR